MMDSARVVVIGGGNMGASVLYHLAKEGWTDIVLIEKAELTSGATWHAAGLVSRMTPGHALGICHDYAVDLYKTIEDETEQGVSWHNCGSLRVAATEDHRSWLMHTRDAVLARGQECQWLSPAEIAKLNPIYDTSHIIGGIYTPDDGHVDPSGTCQAMAKGARLRGARIMRRNRVTNVQQLPSGEWKVITEQGDIICEHVVNAGGYHARQIGAFSGLDLPIIPMQHHYVVTDSVPEFAAMDHEIPVTRDDYYTGYLRREQGGALIGLYDTHDALAKWRGGCPWDSENELFEPDYERITPWLEKCFERYPSLMNLGIKRIVNGAITYTPDGHPLVGPAQGLKNYWLACGATVGIAWGPGLGRALAQWMVHGTAEISMRGFDPRRFHGLVDENFTYQRARENYMTRLSLPYPQLQYETCREHRVSGAHDRTKALHAVFEEAGGWERPRVYGDAAWGGKEPQSWKRGPSWQAAVTEARAVHSGVGLGDFSAFSKFEITGPEAEAYLNRLCANRMPRKVGGTCLTLLLNERGTIEGEATIARLGENRFWFVTGGPSERRVWDWITMHQRGTEDVTVSNLSDDWGILTVAGPKARDVLAPLTEASLEDSDFGWLKAREITVAGVPVIALRLSFSGELAWELHAPNAQLSALWDAIWAKGQIHGIVPFGSKALELMRMEKAYRGGHELANDATPIHTDQMRFVKMDKEFIGKQALSRLAATGTSSVIAYLDIDMEGTDVLGGEAVYRNGDKVGSISSGGYGPVSGRNLAFAFVQPEAALPGTKLQVMVFGNLYPATVLFEAVLDPENLRLRDVAAAFA
ncbi:FAD-dependent oxidoreductase [Ruegeria sp. SCP11]|uniref:FAD-dependent oxidoreductase n=1 Tax=Ruegeria sp. SCP11 TaxID=3141378 RepID=UPI003339C535